MDEDASVKGFNRAFRVLDSKVYREAVRASSQADPVPEWVVPFSFIRGSELQRIAAHLAVDEGAAVVDLGCGLGGTALWIAERTGAKVTGVDWASEAVESASEHAQRRGQADRVSFLVANMTETGLESGSFDGVTSVDAIMFADPDLVCAEMARLLRHGGKVALIAIEPEIPVRETAVTDYRPYFDRAGLEVGIHEPTPDWPENRERFFGALRERAARLREELGEAAEPLLDEAQTPPGVSARVFITATKR
ncbi:MAG: class I SAM-dependent methyltransferase [Candidatus Eremiobacteraeota bacterium]|nr:class I SAM-dependent methyltransferase [Candidatus Eremiobacteraeota bacterium]